MQGIATSMTSAATNYDEPTKAGFELPDDAELIAQATLALVDDSRVLTQGRVADAFAIAAGVITKDQGPRRAAPAP